MINMYIQSYKYTYYAGVLACIGIHHVSAFRGRTPTLHWTTGGLAETPAVWILTSEVWRKKALLLCQLIGWRLALYVLGGGKERCKPKKWFHKQRCSRKLLGKLEGFPKEVRVQMVPLLIWGYLVGGYHLWGGIKAILPYKNGEHFHHGPKNREESLVER